MKNKFKLLTVLFTTLLVSCSNQVGKNIITVNDDFNEKETNIIRTLIQEGLFVNLKTNENIDFDFEIGFVHYKDGKKINEANVLKFKKDDGNKDVSLDSYISINRIKNNVMCNLYDDGVVSIEEFSIANSKDDWKTSSLNKEIDLKDIEEIVLASYYIDSKQDKTIISEKDLKSSKEAIGIIFKRI